MATEATLETAFRAGALRPQDRATPGRDMLDLKSLIRSIPDYPKPGILFRDITTLIEHPQGFKESVERLAEAHRGPRHHACRGDRGARLHLRGGRRDRDGRRVRADPQARQAAGRDDRAELHARIWRRHHRDPRRRAERRAQGAADRRSDRDRRHGGGGGRACCGAPARWSRMPASSSTCSTSAAPRSCARWTSRSRAWCRFPGTDRVRDLTARVSDTASAAL